MWTGDQLMDFSRTEGLPSVIPATLSLGFSGLGFTHSDIGGHRNTGWTRRSPRCLGRWMELAAFSPVFRTHEGNRPDRNSQFWSEASLRALFARCSEIYSILKPYHRVVAREYTVSGLPPIRHPALHYESEELLHEEVYQYLYGRDILVAPVLDADSSFRSLHLPDDAWIHLWSSRRFGGGRIVIEAPFGYPAVFYRAASPFAALFDAIRRTLVKI